MEAPLSETVKCPYCAERIQADALVCRFCNRQVRVPAAHEISSDGTDVSTASQTTDSPPPLLAAASEPVPASQPMGTPPSAQTSGALDLTHSPFRLDPEEREPSIDPDLATSFTVKDVLFDAAWITVVLFIIGIVCAALNLSQTYLPMPVLYACAGARLKETHDTRRKRLAVTSLCVGVVSGLLNMMIVWVMTQGDMRNALPSSSDSAVPSASDSIAAVGFVSFVFLLLSPIHALIGAWLTKWFIKRR